MPPLPARAARFGRGGGRIAIEESGDGLPETPGSRTERWLAGEAVGVVYAEEAFRAARPASSFCGVTCVAQRHWRENTLGDRKQASSAPLAPCKQAQSFAAAPRVRLELAPREGLPATWPRAGDVHRTFRSRDSVRAAANDKLLMLHPEAERRRASPTQVLDVSVQRARGAGSTARPNFATTGTGGQAYDSFHSVDFSAS